MHISSWHISNIYKGSHQKSPKSGISLTGGTRQLHLIINCMLRLEVSSCFTLDHITFWSLRLQTELSFSRVMIHHDTGCNSIYKTYHALQKEVLEYRLTVPSDEPWKSQKHCRLQPDVGLSGRQNAAACIQVSSCANRAPLNPWTPFNDACISVSIFHLSYRVLPCVELPAEMNRRASGWPKLPFFNRFHMMRNKFMFINNDFFCAVQ